MTSWLPGKTEIQYKPAGSSTCLGSVGACSACNSHLAEELTCFKWLRREHECLLRVLPDVCRLKERFGMVLLLGHDWRSD
jgi:hypothetical protein